MARCILTDLDRTLTGPDLILQPSARERIARLREGGVRVIIVSGRTLEYMTSIGLLSECDAVVAENGAVVCIPGEKTLEIYGSGFPEAASRALGPLARHFQWGRSLGSGPRPHARDASTRLREAGVEHSLSFNAEEVMILPPGIDKGFGARRALHHLRLSEKDAWAIGDGENDVALFAVAAVAGAPANASEAAYRAATRRLGSEYSAAFLEFTDELVVAAYARSSSVTIASR